MDNDPRSAGRSGMPDAGGPELAALTERARQDGEAFGLLYERYYERILNYAYRCTLDLSAAEEVTSNTFFNALRALGSYQDKGTFQAWLYRIATNEVRSRWRRQRRRQEGARRWAQDLRRLYFQDCPENDLAGAEERLARFARLHQVLSGLPARYRAAISLRYFQDLPLGEVAQALGTKVGTVKSLIHRGLALMSHRLATGDATFRPEGHSP